VISAKPEAVVATGEKHIERVEDVAFITVYFPKHIIAHVNVNWAVSRESSDNAYRWFEKENACVERPRSRRKLRIYDKGVSMSANPSNLHQLLVSYRFRRHVGKHTSSRSKHLARGNGLLPKCIERTRSRSMMVKRRCASCRIWKPLIDRFAVEGRQLL